MMEYKLLAQDSVKKLTAEVSECLKDDWQVHGSPFAFGMHNQPAMLLQAVVRWTKEQVGQIIESMPVPTGLKGPLYKFGYDA